MVWYDVWKCWIPVGKLARNPKIKTFLISGSQFVGTWRFVLAIIGD